MMEVVCFTPFRHVLLDPVVSQAPKKPLFPMDEAAMLPNHVMLDLKVSIAPLWT
jgi:hypothetical protein